LPPATITASLMFHLMTGNAHRTQPLAHGIGKFPLHWFSHVHHPAAAVPPA
jgi:hypothetical protein